MNLEDFAVFAFCFGLDASISRGCTCSDLDLDGEVAMSDFQTFVVMFQTNATLYAPNCR